MLKDSRLKSLSRNLHQHLLLQLIQLHFIVEAINLADFVTEFVEDKHLRMTVIVLKSIGAEFPRLSEQEPQQDPHNIAEITDGIQHYSLIRAVTAFKATFEKVLANATSPCDFA